jgi:mycothiol synthase
MSAATINPIPPTRANLAWRLITQDDLAAVADLARSGFVVDGGIVFMFEPENVKESYFPDAPGASIGAWTPNGRLGACATVHHLGAASTQRARIVGMVRPDLRGRGIGDYLMRWSKLQAQVLLAGAAADNRVLQIATESLSEPADRLYRRHGFEQVFEELVMERDLLLSLPDRPHPLDVTILTWQPDRAEQFFQAYEASFRERPGFPGYTAEEWIGRVVSNDLMPEWSLLAIAHGVPVGFVIGNIELTIDPPGGHIWQIGVVPEQRRRGLASALLVDTMRQMLAAGAVKALLTVNINNPGAFDAYERLGFKTVGRRARYESSGNFSG